MKMTGLSSERAWLLLASTGHIHAMLWCGVGLSDACVPLCDVRLLSGTQSCGQETGQTEDTFGARMKSNF